MLHALQGTIQSYCKSSGGRNPDILKLGQIKPKTVSMGRSHFRSQWGFPWQYLLTGP